MIEDRLIASPASARENCRDYLAVLAGALPGGMGKLILSMSEPPRLRMPFCSEKLKALLGVSPEQWEHAGKHEDYLPLFPASFVRDLLQVCLNGIPFDDFVSHEFRFQKPSGEAVWLQLTGSLLVKDVSSYTLAVVLLNNTARHEFEEQMRLDKERYRIIEEVSDDILFEYDIQTDIVYFAEKFVNVTGVKPVVPSFTRFLQESGMIPKEDHKNLLHFLTGMREGIPGGELTLRIRHWDGSFVWYRVTYAAIFSPAGNPSRAVGKLFNIDRQKQEILSLLEKTQRDPLTGLYNKPAIQTLCEQSLEFEKDCLHAFLIVDIDNFKYLNDTLGHLYGDAVLIEASKRMEDQFEDLGEVARVGGDEFFVFLRCAQSIRSVEQSAELLCKNLQEINLSDGGKGRIFGSVGVSVYPRDGHSFNELYRNCDTALSQSKERGKNCYTLYEDKMQRGHFTARKEQAAEGRQGDTGLTDRLYTLFAETDSLERAIDEALAYLGIHFHVSRSYLFENSSDNRKSSNTFEWCAPGVVPQKENLQDLPYQDIGQHDHAFDENGIFCCSNINFMDEAPREVLRAQGIESMLHVAIFDKGVFRGYVGYDECDSNRKWPKDEIESLAAASRIVGAQVLRLRDAEQTQQLQQTIQALVEARGRLAYAIDPDSYRIYYLSVPMQRLFPEAAIGDICYHTFYGRHAPCLGGACAACQTTGMSSPGAKCYELFSGKMYSFTSRNALWTGGRPLLFITSEEEAVTDSLSSSFDLLTRLPDLRNFKAEAEHLLSVPDDTRYLLLSADFNKFKHINESFGYARGDDMILSFSKYLSSFLEGGDLICRAANDNFLVLSSLPEDCAPADFCERIAKGIDQSLHEEFQAVHFAISFGATVVRSGTGNISSAIDQANIARKTNKESHTTCFALYSERMAEDQKKEKEIESRMLMAVENGEFIPYFQPIYALPSETLVSAEALVRWNDPHKGLLAPMEFLPLFEKNGFITTLDYEIFERICKWMRRWRSIGKELPKIAVNVSRLHLSDPDFVDKYDRIAQKYQIPRDRIELELTESAILFDNYDILQDSMERLHELGFSLSIDDFGSGYSSLSLIMSTPCDIVKLDKSFFQAEMSVDKNRSFLQSVIRMVRQLGMKVIAEGVETGSHTALLKELNCDMAQGYYFARPMPAEDFEKLLKS